MSAPKSSRYAKLFSSNQPPSSNPLPEGLSETPPVPEDPYADTPLNELPFPVCGMCRYRTALQGICMALPPQIVPRLIVPAPVKVVRPGSMPPMSVHVSPMRVVVQEREAGCGLFDRLADQEYQEREEYKAKAMAALEGLEEAGEADDADTPDTPPTMPGNDTGTNRPPLIVLK